MNERSAPTGRRFLICRARSKPGHAAKGRRRNKPSRPSDGRSRNQRASTSRKACWLTWTKPPELARAKIDLPLAARSLVSTPRRATGRNFCFFWGAVNTNLKTFNADNRRLIDGLRKALEINHVRMFETAKQQWERNFAGNDPSDSCVSVRVTSGDSQGSSLPSAGFLRKGSRSLLSISGRPSLA
jgi:hypothetical protein